MLPADPWQLGYAAGFLGWRPTGGHHLPSSHPTGADPAGTAWFLGCLAGLTDAHHLHTAP